MLSCTFRYGRDDMDVMGVAFRRDIFVTTRQVYPELQDKERSIHTKMQEKLLRKLGDNAIPFFFEVTESRHMLLGEVYPRYRSRISSPSQNPNLNHYWGKF